MCNKNELPCIKNDCCSIKLVNIASTWNTWFKTRTYTGFNTPWFETHREHEYENSQIVISVLKYIIKVQKKLGNRNRHHFLLFKWFIKVNISTIINIFLSFVLVRSRASHFRIGMWILQESSLSKKSKGIGIKPWSFVSIFVWAEN